MSLTISVMGSRNNKMNAKAAIGRIAPGASWKPMKLSAGIIALDGSDMRAIGLNAKSPSPIVASCRSVTVFQTPVIML